MPGHYRARLAVGMAGALAATIGAQEFVHPGVLIFAEQITYIQTQIAAKQSPIFDAYIKALASPYASLAYVAQGPPANGVIECGSYSKPNLGCSDEDDDASSAYLQALLYNINGTQQYATNAIAIMNKYATHLKKYNNSNAPLQAGWGLAKWARAAELMIHNTRQPNLWDQTQAAEFIAMLYRVPLPLIADGSSSNGNWELTMIEGIVGLGVVSDNMTLFDCGIAMWNGRVPAYFYISSDGPGPNRPDHGYPSWYGQAVYNASVDGICQETCRDLGHTSYGVASTFNVAETAFIQGIDLYTPNTERLTAALEFQATILLQAATAVPPIEPGQTDHDVPQYVCNGQGVIIQQYPTYEVGYNAFVNRLKVPGVTLPNTLAHLVKSVRTMADEVDPHMMIYETLTHGGSG